MGAPGPEDELAALVGPAQAGGEWALEAIYRALSPQVVRYLRSQVGVDAEDVASETWISVARALGSFEGDGDALRALVFTIARRRAVDHVRKLARTPLPVAGRVAESAEDLALGDEVAKAVAEALPEEQAQIVLLRVVGGLSVEEVAAIVGRRPGTVRVLQHRALKRLAKIFPDGL